MRTNEKRPNHGNYTSENSAVPLVKQKAIQVGLRDGKHPSHIGGATDVTIKKGSTAYGKGHTTPPSAGNRDVINGRHQKVQVHQPTPYNHKTTNDGYMNSDRNNFLK